MPAVMKSSTVYSGLFCLFLFVVGFVLIPAPYFGELMNAVLFSISSGLVVTYTPAVWGAICEKGHQQAYFFIAIWMGALSVALRGLVALWWRFNGRPEEFTDSFIWLFVVFLSLLSAIMYQTAPGAVNGRVPTRNWIIVGISTSIGLLIVTSGLYWLN